MRIAGVIYGISSRETVSELLQSHKGKREGRESLFKEIMANDFPNLRRVLDIQFHEAHRYPRKSSENFSRTFLIELSKSKPKQDS